MLTSFLTFNLLRQALTTQPLLLLQAHSLVCCDYALMHLYSLPTWLAISISEVLRNVQHSGWTISLPCGFVSVKSPERLFSMPWGYISNSLDMAMACGTQSRVDWERINKIFLKMRISGLERWLGGGEDRS